MPVRPATAADAPLVRRFVLELAEYERLLSEAEAHCREENLRAHLAADANPRLEGFIAEDDAGEPVGFALFYRHYSTFQSNWGVYLEDLYVRPAQRGAGYGLALLRAVAEAAVVRGAVRMDWQVLDWNEPAIRFYERLGAKAMADWTVMRLTGDALRAVAASG